MPWQCVLFTTLDWRDNGSGTGRTRYFRGPDGEEHTFKTLPIGAMFYDDDCHWQDGCKKADGRCLVVKVPGRDGGGQMRGFLWAIDHPSTGDGPGWTRSGAAPDVTVSPSINYVGSYHGWLQNGILSDDIEGRTFP